MNERITVSESYEIPFDREFTLDTFNATMLEYFDLHNSKWKDTNPEILSFRFWSDSYYDEISTGMYITFKRDLTQKEIDSRNKSEERRKKAAESRKRSAELRKQKAELEERTVYEKLKAKYG